MTICHLDQVWQANTGLKNPEQVVTPRQLRVLPLPHTPGQPLMDYGAKDAGNVAENRKQEGPLPIITQDGVEASFLQPS